MANILEAVYRIVERPIIDVKQFYQAKSRANSTGDALEKYVKDIFSNTFDETNGAVIDRKYSEIFSYLGNTTNPPDIILKNGDAIEIKKIEAPNASLALNSSYPKSKLYSDSSLITAACKNCEKWTIKDIAYIVGHVSSDKLKYLWIVYGDCFAADKSVYEKTWNAVSKGINNIPNIEFSATNELGRVNKVDPLGITYLRVRGMWHIANPSVVFNNIAPRDISNKLQLNVLMKLEKFNSFPDADKQSLLNLKKDNYLIEDVEFKNPDNPAQLLKGKLITYKIK